MITTDELEARKLAVEEAINSVQLEGLTLSQAQLDNFHDYANGLITLEQMQQTTNKVYVRDGHV